MTFAAPSYLAAVLVVPLVAALWAGQRRRRHRFAVRFPGATVIAGVLGDRPGLAPPRPPRSAGLRRGPARGRARAPAGLRRRRGRARLGDARDR